ncbi:MAG TPA: hypothetical protein VMT75_08055 [Candidatus Saccharimonadales bacterium]|nr:hypothetical protein [Candidatus Saccharimonadales bacterium]
MEEYQDESQPTQQENRDRWADLRAQVNRPLAVVVVALVVFLGISAGYGLHQRAKVSDLTAQSAATNQTLAQLQSQVNTLTSQIQGMTQASQAQAQAQSAAAAAASEEDTAPEAPTPVAQATAAPAAPAAAAKSTPAKKHAVKHSTASDKRYAQLQAQLAEQQKELKDTQDQMEKYRSDLEGNISSTRTELSGAIAKNHDELLVLEKKGERNYYEFELTKSKQFQRVGPLSISLRKTDTKHKSYDLSTLVDDNELSKKKVNLYEPVVIHAENEGQPVQIIVNHIDKDLVHGYVSAPKYRPSELTPASTSASVSPTAAAVAPNSGVAAGSNAHSPQ